MNPNATPNKERAMIGFEDPSKLAMNSKTAASVEDAIASGRSIIEPKWDGIRLLVHVTEDGVKMYARSGKSKTGKLPHIDTELLANLPAGTWLDGEAVAFNADGTQDWGGAQSVLGSDASRAMDRTGISLVVFDLLAHGGLDARGVTLAQRRSLLEQIFSQANFTKAVCLSPARPATAEAHEEHLALGFEGSMVKHLDARYMSGKRAACSLKLKATDTVDCVITGFAPGAPDSWIAHSGLIGAIEFVHYAADGTAIEGKCSGMTVAVREQMTRDQASLVGTVVEVSFMTKMPSGTLRHPQFKRLRTDKTAAECQR